MGDIKETARLVVDPGHVEEIQEVVRRMAGIQTWIKDVPPTKTFTGWAVVKLA